MVRAESSGDEDRLMKSRNLWIGLMVLVALTLAVTSPALAQDLPKIDVDIDTNDGGGEWYKNPVVIGGAFILFLLVVALAGRGSGTTVVKS
jgi:hypothetical protein